MKLINSINKPLLIAIGGLFIFNLAKRASIYNRYFYKKYDKKYFYKKF